MLDIDSETTLTLGPEERQRILAEAFLGTDDATVRLTAPRLPSGIPSPLGDDDAPDTERPTLPGTPISLRMSHAGFMEVAEVDHSTLVLTFSCLFAIAATAIAVLHQHL